MRRDHLKRAASFPSDEGCHAASGPIPRPSWSFYQAPTSENPSKPSFSCLLHDHGKARPQHSQTKSPSALSRFLNGYPWPTRALIRLSRKEAERALDRARPRRGPKPRLLVVLGLVTLEKRGLFKALPLSFFHGKWGLHLVVVYLVYGDPKMFP